MSYGRSVRAPSHPLCAEATGSSCSSVLRHAVVDRRCSTQMESSTKVCRSGSNWAPLMDTGKRLFLAGALLFACHFYGFSLLMQILAVPSRSTCFITERPNQVIVPTSSSRHMHPTSHSTPEIYGSWGVELMFIFYQIAKHNS